MARRAWFRVGIPLAASLGAHVLLFSLLGLSRWEVTVGAASAGPREYAVTIADNEPATPDTLAWPGTPDTPTALEALAEWPDYAGNPDETTTDTNTGLRELAAAADAARNADQTAGGFGIGDAGASSVLGLGGGAGDAGSGGGGLGIGLGGASASAGVWNVRAGGTRFAYVVDFSGSIIVAVDALKRELKRSVGKLSKQQSFNVIIFYSVSGQRAEEFRTERFTARMQPATNDAKQAFFDWIDRKQPSGSTEPLAALQQALRMRPDAVFLFSDGWFDERVESAVQQVNADVGAQIHCLVFDELLLQDTSDVPRLTRGAQRLQRIAEASNGQFKVVTGADLR